MRAWAPARRAGSVRIEPALSIAAKSLRKWEPFSHFTPAQLDRLAPHLARCSFPAGAAILRQGDPSQEAYVIESGEVRIQRGTSYGIFTLARLGAGHLFGETAFIDRQKRSGDAVTTVATDLLSLNPAVLTGLMERDQQVSVALYWSFWKSLSLKLRQTNDRLTHFFTESGRPPSVPPVLPGDVGPEFCIDLDAKRKLFAEQKLPSLEINFLSLLSREVKLRPGEVIFREGEPGDRMYVVLEGRVMISKFIPGAGEEALAFLERGDYFGEMALIERQPRSADAKAHDAGGAVVLSIPQDVVDGLLDIRKVSAVGLLRILCRLVSKRLREVDDKLITWYILAGGNVPEIR